MSCTCPACRDFATLCWTRLAGDTWVLSAHEHLFAPASVLCAVDPAGEAIWFGDRSPVASSAGDVDG